MKELLQQYAAYNIWANKIIFSTINELSEAQQTTTIVSSFPSIYKTVNHMWSAENIWWQRTNLVANIVSPAANFTGSFSELCSQLAIQSQQWKTWVDGTDDATLHKEFAYVRNNEQYTIIIKNMLLHLFNHATFHRGQLITFLRQLGVDKIPSTDFSTYCRIIE